MAGKKMVYPIILHRTKDGFYVEIPDFEIGTQGKDVAESMDMARDAIGLMGIDMEDDGIELPQPYSKQATEEREGDIKTLVDVDFLDYRLKHDNKVVKKNCTIPYWISVEAERVGVNYSQTLQEALVKKLKLKHNVYR